MKRELKIGESQIITIDEYGVLTIPSNPTETVWMNDCELVELFGVTFPTLRTHINSILKSGVVCADFRYGATQYGNQLLPDCYGLEMIMALAFRIQSPQAELFRRWILEKVTKTERSVVNQQVFISVDKSINRLIN